MPKYYNAGQAAIVPEVFATHAVDEEHKKELLAAARKHHPITSPNRERLCIVDGAVHLKVPEMYCPRDKDGSVIPKTVPWEAGSVALGIMGFGHVVVPPGKFVEIDSSVPESAIKSQAPFLLTETEYALITQSAPAEASSKKQKQATI